MITDYKLSSLLSIREINLRACKPSIMTQILQHTWGVAVNNLLRSSMHEVKQLRQACHVELAYVHKCAELTVLLQTVYGSVCMS